MHEHTEITTHTQQIQHIHFLCIEATFKPVDNLWQL